MRGDRGDLLSLAMTFASKVSAHDFWDDDGLPGHVGELGGMLRRFATTGDIDFRGETTAALPGSDPDLASWLFEERVLELWRRLALLGRLFEDVWQEWYLPTALGDAVS